MINTTKETLNYVRTLNFPYLFIKKIDMSKKLTTKEFIKKAILVHGNRYNYDLVNYNNNHTKIKIVCHIHGVFEQLPNSHTSKKCGCFKCGGHGTTTKEFVDKCILKHGDVYDYSQTFYNGISNKVEIICKKHGVFKQTAYTHLIGCGCRKCSDELIGINSKFSTEEFIKKAKIIHGEKYDYSLVNYENSKSKVKIICNIHGDFLQQANSHLRKRGCPKCSESHGEKEIRIFLDENKIKYDFQKKFLDCFNPLTKRLLPFDFYLPNYNTCIEFQGRQHFEIKNGYFGASPEKASKLFERLKENDRLKNEYCKLNNIQILIINYNENIEKNLKLHIDKYNNENKRFYKDASRSRPGR